MIDDNCTWLLPTPSLSQAFRRRGDSKFMLALCICVSGEVCTSHVCLQALCDSVLMATRGSWDLCLCALCACVQVTVTRVCFAPFSWWNWKMSFSSSSKAHPGWCRAGWDFSSSSQTQTPSYTVQRTWLTRNSEMCLISEEKAPKFLLRFNNPLNEA